MKHRFVSRLPREETVLQANANQGTTRKQQLSAAKNAVRLWILQGCCSYPSRILDEGAIITVFGWSEGLAFGVVVMVIIWLGEV